MSDEKQVRVLEDRWLMKLRVGGRVIVHYDQHPRCLGMITAFTPDLQTVSVVLFPPGGLPIPEQLTMENFREEYSAPDDFKFRQWFPFEPSGGSIFGF